MLPSPIADALRQLSLEELSTHKLLGLATSRAVISREWRAVGEQRLLANLKRQSVSSGILEEIALDRRARTMQIGLLKGAALWGDLYQPGEREAADIDLFINERDEPILGELLRDLGFKKIPQPHSKATEFKALFLSDRFGDLSIETHTKLWWRQPNDFQWSWRAAERAPFARLTIEDQLIHLCGHWVAQHTMISLHWLFDIVLFLNKYEANLDWHRLKARAKTLRLSRSVEVACNLAKRIQGPDGFNSLNDSLVSFDFLTQPKSSALRYFLIKHSVQESLADALRYDLDWIRLKLRGKQQDYGL